VAGEVRNLQVHVGKVDGKLVEPIVIDEVSYQVDLGERFQVDKMAFKGIKLDLPARRIDIAEVSNSGTGPACCATGRQDRMGQFAGAEDRTRHRCQG
jgi:hypothetical protein